MQVNSLRLGLLVDVVRMMWDQQHMRLRLAHAVCEHWGGLGWAQLLGFHGTAARGTVALYGGKAEEKLQLVSGLPSITESSGSAASGENEELSDDSASGQAPTFFKGTLHIFNGFYK